MQLLAINRDPFGDFYEVCDCLGRDIVIELQSNNAYFKHDESRGIRINSQLEEHSRMLAVVQRRRRKWEIS